MTTPPKGILSNAFAQRALLHADGSIEAAPARTGQDVNPGLKQDTNLTLNTGNTPTGPGGTM